MGDFTTQETSVTDVNLDELTFFNPDVDEFEPKVLATIVVGEGETERKLNFLCKRVDGDRILLELPDKDALIFSNAKHDLNIPKVGEPITQEWQEFVRVLREFNTQAIRLGLVKPKLTPEQIDALPERVLDELARVIAPPIRLVNPEEE